jgi:tetratricopeptide (TPR) repeat protein
MSSSFALWRKAATSSIHLFRRGGCIAPLQVIVRQQQQQVPLSFPRCQQQQRRPYSAPASRDLHMIEVIGQAIDACNFEVPPTENEVANWLQKLQSDEDITNVSDIDEREAANILRRIGIKNAKLRNAIIRVAFPPVEPSPVVVPQTKGEKEDEDAENENWRKLQEEVQQLRSQKRWKELTAKLMDSLDYATQMGENIHPFYLPSLYQELAQAYYKLEQYEFALESNATAMSIYTSGENVHKMMEALEFQGVILAGLGQHEPSAITFSKVIEWAQKHGKEGSPIEACVAKELLRTSQSYYGEQLVNMKQYDTAEEVLSECLAPNAEANDFWSTLRTLRALMDCFEATNDFKRCLSTAERAALWCDKYKQPEIKKEIEVRIDEFKAKASSQ